MSHNVMLSGIKFSDVSILKEAFAELQREVPAASGYSFVGEPTTVRGWARATARVDAAIKCPDQSYDIGFKRNAAGELVPFLEHGFCAPGVSTQPGAKTVEGDACGFGHENRALGLLQQRYAVITAEQNARRMGSMVRRVKAADGQIQLEVSHR